MKLNKILVPLDDSANSEEVLSFVIQIACANPKAEVTLITITKLDSAGDSASAFKLDAFTDLLASKGIESNFIITESLSAADKINEWAEEYGYDLIAMSTRGRGGVTGAILGSITTEVIRLATVPVMVVAAGRTNKHKLNSPKISEIVVPLDGSLLSESSLPFAEHLAKTLNIGVRVMNVVTPPELTVPSPIDESSYFVHTKITPEIYENAKEYLANISNTLIGKGLNVLSRNVLTGNTASSLIGSIKDPAESLFVISTHGKSGVDRLLMGSVTDSILRSYGGPVFVIPANSSRALTQAPVES